MLGSDDISEENERNGNGDDDDSDSDMNEKDDKEGIDESEFISSVKKYLFLKICT